MLRTAFVTENWRAALAALVILNKLPQHADLLLGVLHKIEAVVLTPPNLEEVVVAGFLGEPELCCPIIIPVSNEAAFVVPDSIEELPPDPDQVHDLSNRSLPLLVLLAILG